MLPRVLKQAWSKRWNRWVNRRLPRSDSRRFMQNNIFILPTGMGWLFAALLVVMLLTAINYQNSLIFLLTFFLGVVFVAAMHQTHSNLAGLELTLVHAGEGYVGDSIPFLVRGSVGKENSLALSLSLEGRTTGGRLDMQHVLSESTVDMRLLVPASQRGFLKLDRVKIETRFPFGLLRAWSWLRPKSAGIVYPKPLTPPVMPDVDGDGEDSGPVIQVQGQDHAELRPWRQGDLSQRVLWKRYARTGEMAVADWHGEQGRPYWLDFSGFPGVDVELRLSYLAALVLERTQAGDAFGLRLPGVEIEPDVGPAHTKLCLRNLGTYGMGLGTTELEG